MTNSLSLQQARKLVLLSQQLPSAKRGGVSATQAAIEQLGYVQLDTISVVQRAHHHTLFSRNRGYQAEHLEQLLADKKVFEYWSHAAAYLPMRDYRFSLWRQRAIASGEQSHWFAPNPKLEAEVLARISAEGPLQAKDFEGDGKRRGDWSSKPNKRALENLFMRGELMIPRRINFHKVYDLTERVLPADIDTKPPTPLEYGRHLITGFLRANGLGQLAQFGYLLKQVKPLLQQALAELLEQGEVIEVDVAEQRYYALAQGLALLEQRHSRSKLAILSPFDNLLIQRKRMQALFGFDYLIECYLPANKRQYGYFALPLLWQGRLVGRMDCKADRATRVLHLRQLTIEDKRLNLDQFAAALAAAMPEFLRFQQCQRIELHHCEPESGRAVVLASLKPWLDL